MGSIGPTTPSKVTTTDVDNLKSLLNGTSAEIRLPSDANYSESIKRWSAAAVKQAGIAILPTDNSQVSKVVKYVADRNIDLAVKGGGHSTAGVSSTDGGVLLDLHNISYVDVDTERKLLRIGGGANWGQVDQAAFKHGLGTVGGTVADTGVGGLALGGGYGWFSGTHGLVIDCLVECTVVLASGDAVKASETENPGLFWALRGAGQNVSLLHDCLGRMSCIRWCRMGSIHLDRTSQGPGRSSMLSLGLCLIVRKNVAPFGGQVVCSISSNILI